MAQKPTDQRHQSQIDAGTTGRKRGHAFEKELADRISSVKKTSSLFCAPPHTHCITGRAEIELLRYIIFTEKISGFDSIETEWLGGHATMEKCDATKQKGKGTKSKSDIVVRFHVGKEVIERGVSVKVCNKKSPTNDQIYFTTASAFCELLKSHGIPVSDKAVNAMRCFCGDSGFTPDNIGNSGFKLSDMVADMSSRASDTKRWFWEELPTSARKEWECDIFSKHQDKITRLLLQKAYPNDPIEPSYILHQTHKCEDASSRSMAIFSMDEIVKYSRRFNGFHCNEYKIRKGSWKHDPAMHLAPRFGFVQFQRAGNRQHPTQLQFNLKAGYFNDIKADP